MRTLAFVLPGRRTLSEHLPAEIIELPVSVAESSAYLRRVIIAQALKNPGERRIHLPGVDSVGFRFYVEWLKTGHIAFHTAATTTSGSGLLLRDCFDLMFAHIVGSLFEEPDFQDYIIDIMAKHLNASQTPDLKVLEEVFLEKGISNVLRQFVIDRMFAVERKMLGMMRGTALEAAEGEAGCEYHVHETGKCYRANVKYVLTIASLTATNLATNDPNTYCFDSETTPPSSTISPNSYADNSRPYSMSHTQYLSSEKWSRDVHGLVRSVEPPDLRRLEKPLPSIPPLTPGLSPSPLSSHGFSQSSVTEPLASSGTDNDPDKAIELPTTQQLVRECLSRLPTTPSSPKQSRAEHVNQSQTELVLDCLRRLKLLSTDDAISTVKDDVSTYSTSSADPQLDDKIDSTGRSSPKQVSPCLQPIPDSPQLRSERSFDELPRSAYLSRGNERVDAMNGDATQPYPVAGPYKQAGQFEYYTPRARERPRSQLELPRVELRPTERHQRPRSHLELPGSNTGQAEQQGHQDRRRSQLGETQHRAAATYHPQEHHSQRQNQHLDHPRTTTTRPVTHIGFSHPQALNKSSHHPYAHLGFSKPRPRIVDPQVSAEILPEDTLAEQRYSPLTMLAQVAIKTDEEMRLSTAPAPMRDFGFTASVKRKPAPWKVEAARRGDGTARNTSSTAREASTAPASTPVPNQTLVASPTAQDAAKTTNLAQAPPTQSPAPPSPSSFLPKPLLLIDAIDLFPFQPVGPSNPTPTPNSPSAPTPTPTTRKPAPPRGLDWVSQQARNPFRSESAAGIEKDREGVKWKKSRKSRLGELLRAGKGNVVWAGSA
jgi:hypothetical protein